MSLNPTPAETVPNDWRAYSGTLSRRVFAFMIDYILILVLCVPAAFVVFFLGLLTLGLGFYLYPVLFFIVAALYFGLTVGGDAQASPGMRAMGIAMIRVDGQRIDFLRAMGIAMIRVDGQRIDFLLAIVHLALFWILNSILTPLVLLVGLFTDRSRLLHDLLIGTAVIRT